MSIKILADSGCDLSLEFLESKGITLIPLGVHLDEKEYEDLITIHPKEVYDAMRAGKAPKTSQVSPHRFKELFTELAKENITCMYITLSSELSGTYQTAVMMKNEVLEEYPNFKLSIIDSKGASLGIGFVVSKAQELVDAGKAFEEIEAEINFYCSHMEHIFTVEDLEYLARGGRISKASAFVGGLLNIKPLLNMKEGKLVPLEKLRGKKKALKRILDIMEERGKNLEDQIIGISHGDDENSALELKELISERFGVQSFLINTIGSAIGAHAGPGTLAVFFLNDIIE